MEDRLRKFAALLDAGGFTAAARQLHISQPALSAAMAKLERELHAELLVRGARPLRPTAAGQLAYAAAKELAVSLDNLAVRLHELAQAEHVVRLGMIDSVASTLFASSSTLAALEQRADVSIVVNNSRFLAQEVERGALDAAFVAHSRQFGPRFEVQPLGDEPLVVVCHAALADTLAAALQRGGLTHFISYDRPSVTFQLVASSLRAQGVRLAPSFYCTSPEVMLRLVRLQKGAAALPYLLVRELVAAGELRLLGEPGPLLIQRPIVMLSRRGSELSRPLRQAAAQLRRQLRTLQQEALAPTTGEHPQILRRGKPAER